jgi:glutamate racemase
LLAWAALWVAFETLTVQAREGGDESEPPLPWIRVSDDKSHFTAGDDAKPFRPMGFNYDHDADGRLIEDYWHAEWDRVVDDFKDMHELGANVVRVHLQFGRFMKSPTEANAAELERLAKLLELAQQQRLYLDLTGLGCYHKQDVPAWYDALEESARWDAQAIFWEAVAQTCADSPAVFCYDLMNEPVIGGDKSGPDWLGPAFAGKHFVQFVAKETRGRTRPEAAKQWVDQLTAAVRKHDAKHLVTVGFVDWSLDRPGLTSGFVPNEVAGALDFLAVHIYPKSGKVEEAIDVLKGFQTGKPVIIEETFPLGCSMEELEEFMDRSGEDADGWVSFFWGQRPEEIEASAGIGQAITRQWLTKFSERIKKERSDAAVARSGTRQSSDRPNDETGKPEVGRLRLQGDVVQHFIDHGLRHRDGTAAFTIPNAERRTGTPAGERSDKSAAELPIGVFDSGIGGLTVLEAILALDAFNNDSLQPGADGRRDLENESFVYLGDQANMPYGNYPSSGRQDFLRELILKDAAFLLGNRVWADSTAAVPEFTKPPVKGIVIACNTATAWGLEDIRRLVDAWQVPVFVIGVVEAGARGVMELNRSGDERTVAVLATVGTCGIQAYPRAIGRATGQAGQRAPEVIQQGSVSLAGVIEGDPAFVLSDGATSEYLGPSTTSTTAPLIASRKDLYAFDADGLLGDWSGSNSLRLTSLANYIRYDVTTLVEEYRLSGGSKPIDTLVLGCTHFPLVRAEILSEFSRLRGLMINGERPYESLIAEHIDLVDPAELTAKELFRELARTRLRRDATMASPGDEDQFFLSVANAASPEVRLAADGSLDRTYKYSRDPGRLDIEDTRVVPMRLSLLPASSLNLIRSRLPNVWERLQSAP